MSGTPHVAVDIVSALLVVLGGFATLVGSLGLLRLRTFFDRVHAPTLATTLGTWAIALATVLQISALRGQLYLHVLLVGAFISVTAPVTTIFLMRAAVFRARMRGSQEVPPEDAASWKPGGSPSTRESKPS